MGKDAQTTNKISKIQNMKQVNRCRFELRNLVNRDRPGQMLQFIEKNRGALVNDGTTNAELVRVLLARLGDLPHSTEVDEAKKHFEVGLAHLQARTARRTARELARKHFD